jgi:zinc/manganese transport system substrate-binding protein
MKTALSALAVALFLAFPAHAAPIKVVASFSVLGDMVQQIGGPDVEVKTLVGPDGDAHTYQPTPDDVKAITEAKVVFVNGLGLEGWVDRLIKASGTKAPVVVATNGITPRQMTEDGAKVPDPHAWQDLNNAHRYIGNIYAALARALPEKAAELKDRAGTFNIAIDGMDKFVRNQIKEVPEAKRKVITSHDAFGYFGAAYGVTFLAPEGLSTEAEASAADVAKLITQIKAEKVKKLFLENMADPRLIEQIARDSGATMGGTLFSDALSPAGGPAPHYFDMFRNNVPKLVAGMKLNGT